MDPSQDLSALSPLASAVAQTMARVASDIAIVIDHDGVIRDVAEGQAKLPATCADWIGRRWVDTVTADTRRKIELLLEELRTNDVTQRREVNHPSADGEDVPVAWTAIRLGEHGPVVAVGRDLRAVAAIQRRFLDAQHEMELDYWQRRNAENRFRLLFQVASDAVLVVDALSFEVVDANERALALRADARSPLIGRTLTDALPAAARAQVAELLATARGTGRAGEIRVRLAPGAPPAEVSATPFRVGDRLQLLVRTRQGAPDGDDGGLPSTMRALVESTPDAIVVTDSSGRILMSNPAFVALAARGGDARLKGRMLIDVVGDDDGRWQAMIARTRLQGLSPYAALQVRSGGRRIAVQACATLLAEGEQERLGFTLRLLDPAGGGDDDPGFDTWPGLSALRAQVGLVPLATLLQEGALAVERQLLASALRLGGDRLAPTARLLMVTPQSLHARLQALGLLAGALDDDDAPATPPPVLN